MTDRSLDQLEYEAALSEFLTGIRGTTDETREAIWACLQIGRAAQQLDEYETFAARAEHELREAAK